MTLRIPIGIDDFRELREARAEYVDKSHLIREILDRPTVKVILLPRPRRFGKSLNLSMLRYFFEKQRDDLSHLFEGLAIHRAGDAYRAHFQQYPVILLSLKGARAQSFEVCQKAIRLIIQDLYQHHAAVLDHPDLDELDKNRYRALMAGTADEALYRRSLIYLSGALHRAYGKQVVVLIDEYDAPIHAGWTHGYYPQIIDFIRDFFEAGLEDNPHLHKGVLTGILRVARESIFSGLNNLAVYTLLESDFNTCFGFTEPEVTALLEKAGASDLAGPVRAYYNGYVFGGEAIYNPWSILNFVASDSKALVPHWVTTSSNDLVKGLIERHAFALHHDLEALLARGTIEKRIDANVSFPDLADRPQALFGLLVFAGYLRAEQGAVERGKPLPPQRLSIPNEEVAEVYRATFETWMDKALRAEGGAADALLAALLQGDAARLEAELSRLSTYVMSYHDKAARDPERFYHGLILGLLASLGPDYEVRSNRESGLGRPDVLVKPKRAGKPGVVLELKTAGAKGRTLAKALKEGIEQLRDKDDVAELRAAGAAPIHAMVVAFDGKRVGVRSAEPTRASKVKRPPAR